MGPSSPLMIWWMFVWNFIGRFSLLQGFGHQQETSKSQTAQALGLKSQRLAMIWSSNKINIRRKLEGNYPEDGRSDMSNVGLVAIQRTKSYALGVQFMKTSISWAPRRDSRSILPPVSNMQWLGILRNSLEWPSINYQPLTFLLCKVQPVVGLVKSSLSYCFCTIRGDVAYFSPMNWLAKSQQDISNTWCYMTSKQNTAIQLPGWSQWHVIVSFKSNESGWLLAATRRALAFRPELGEAEIEMCISIQIACVWRLQLNCTTMIYNVYAS